LSGPLRDRLDLTVDVPALPIESLGAAAGGEPSADVRLRVVAARACQAARYAEDGILANAALTTPLLTRHCALEPPALRILRAAVTRLGLSARGYDRVRKVGRTIADLDGADHVGADHIAEALQFRATT
jgi:magnesium chelatase family protein